jgi:hypothetical protein
MRELRSGAEKNRSRQDLAGFGLWWPAITSPTAEKAAGSKLEGWRERSEGRSVVPMAAPLGALLQPQPLLAHGGDDAGVGGAFVTMSNASIDPLECSVLNF